LKKRDERMFIMNNSSENGSGLMSVITLIAAAGSVIGSLLFPGIGTVIGLGIGAIIAGLVIIINAINNKK